MARPRRVFPVLMIGVLATGLIVVLVLGMRYIQREQRNTPAADTDNTFRPPTSERSLELTRSAVRSDGVLAFGINRYRLRLERLPTSLEDLIRRPPDLEPYEEWEGPYVTAGLLSDHWGNRYQYRSPGAHNQEGYDLWSMGPDGQDGTPDDIGNWMATGRRATSPADEP